MRTPRKVPSPFPKNNKTLCVDTRGGKNFAAPFFCAPPPRQRTFSMVCSRKAPRSSGTSLRTVPPLCDSTGCVSCRPFRKILFCSSTPLPYAAGAARDFFTRRRCAQQVPPLPLTGEKSKKGGLAADKSAARPPFLLPLAFPSCNGARLFHKKAGEKPTGFSPAFHLSDSLYGRGSL